MAKQEKERPKFASRQVEALSAGFAAGAYRKAGDKFVYSGPEAHWLKELKAAAKPKAEPEVVVPPKGEESPSAAPEAEPEVVAAPEEKAPAAAAGKGGKKPKGKGSDA